MCCEEICTSKHVSALCSPGGEKVHLWTALASGFAAPGATLVVCMWMLMAPVSGQSSVVSLHWYLTLEYPMWISPVFPLIVWRIQSCEELGLYCTPSVFIWTFVHIQLEYDCFADCLKCCCVLCFEVTVMFCDCIAMISALNLNSCHCGVTERFVMWTDWILVFNCMCLAMWIVLMELTVKFYDVPCHVSVRNKPASFTAMFPLCPVSSQWCYYNFTCLNHVSTFISPKWLFLA